MFQDDNFLYDGDDDDEEEDPCYYSDDYLELSVIWEESSKDLGSVAADSTNNSYLQLVGGSRHEYDMPLHQISNHTEEDEEGEEELQDSPTPRMSLKSLKTGELVSFSVHSDGDFTFESCSTFGISTVSGDDSADSSFHEGSFDEDDIIDETKSPQHVLANDEQVAIAAKKEQPYFQSPRSPAGIFRLEQNQLTGSQEESITVGPSCKSDGCSGTSRSGSSQLLPSIRTDENVTPKRNNVRHVPKSSFKRIDFTGGITISEDRASKRERIIAKMKRIEEKVGAVQQILASSPQPPTKMSPPPPPTKMPLPPPPTKMSPPPPPTKMSPPPPPTKMSPPPPSTKMSPLPPSTKMSPPPQPTKMSPPSPPTKTPPQRSKSDGDFMSRQRRKLARAKEKFKAATKQLVRRHL
jgi:hypothetical protein